MAIWDKAADYDPQSVRNWFEWIGYMVEYFNDVRQVFWSS